MEKTPRQEKLLAQQAFDDLRQTLIQGRIRSGQMVSIAELMSLLDYPMAPIRDAVKQAAAIGLVTIYPQRGITILEATHDNLRSVFHFRYLFDQEGARLQALKCDPTRIADLKHKHEQILEQAQHSPFSSELQHQAMAVDWEMHYFLAKSLNNPLTFKAYEENSDRINIVQKSRPPLIERIIPAMQEHLAILQALEAGCTEKAMLTVRQHMQQTLRWWGICHTNMA